MKRKPKPTNWLALILLLIPFFLGAGFLTWRITTYDGQAAAHAARESRENLQTVVEALSASGTETRVTSSGTLEIIIPPHESSGSLIVAKELALTAHQKTATRVRVVTPAGQVLAEAP